MKCVQLYERLGFNSGEDYVQFQRNEAINNVLSNTYTASCFGKIVKTTQYRRFFNGYNLNDPRWLECVTILLMSKINIFGNSVKQRYGNPRYDYISLANRLKIEVKARTLHYHSVNERNRYFCFNFKIEKNKIADIFILFCFDNVFDLNLKDVYVIGKDEEILSSKKMGDFEMLSISKSGGIANNLEKFKLRKEDMEILNKELEIFKESYQKELIINIKEQIKFIANDRQLFRQLTFFDYESL